MQFTASLGALADKYKGDLETIVQTATTHLFTLVVEKSPVDTGRFRANWNVSYRGPDYTTTASTDTSRGAREAAKALRFPVGGVVYMVNGLPYAARLENGYSQQAANGMVRVSVVEFDTFIQQAITATS